MPCQMERQGRVCSDEYQMHPHHQRSSSVRLQAKNRFLWVGVIPVSPAGMSLLNYRSLLLGNLQLHLNTIRRKLKENNDELSEKGLCAGLSNAQTDLAGVEEGVVSGSSMWGRKCSEPKYGSFVQL